MSKFQDKVTSLIKGEDAADQASKIERKVKSAFASQLAALASAKVGAELKVEDAEAALDSVLYPITPTFSSDGYILGVKRAQENVDAAEEELKVVEESIVFYDALVAKVSQ